MLSRPDTLPSPFGVEAGTVSALARLRLDPSLSAAIEAVHAVPGRSATWGEWPAGLDERVLEAARARGIRSVYQHQAVAIEAALGSRNVVIATGTASGKSLCYQLPTLSALCAESAATALYLFPTKALARDQLAVLQVWGSHLADTAVAAAAYDGDSSPRERRAARASARVLLTNPDMLHAGLLPYHPRWERFLSGLRYVIVDEMHVYRGVFGSHVTNVLRRLRRVAAHYGAEPTFILTSATLANPGELGKHLCGGDVQVVDEDTSARGQRVFVFYNPPVVDSDLNLRRGLIVEADRIARHLLESDVQTIVFARTRQTTELLVRYIGEGLARSARSDITVRGYRGGYLPSERRAIEAELRSGGIRCVVTTNALELGVDIGHLDACVMAGYPGTVASTWQQAGRAGRRDRPAVAVLVADSSPLDQYIVRNPAYFLDRSPEHALVDPDNLLVLLGHLRCAVFELPFDAAEAAARFGASTNPAAPVAADLLAVLAAQGDVVHASGTWHWMAGSYPAIAVGLRSIPGDDVAIVLQGADEDVLGTVARGSAAITVHPGAVYLHDGEAYSVLELDLEAGRAIVRPTDDSIYTRPSTSTATRPERVDGDRPAVGCLVAHGELEIRVRATAYRKIRFRTHETVGWGALDLPEQVHLAGAYWFVIDEDTAASLRDQDVLAVDDGRRGPNWEAQRDAARARDGYICRRCRAPERPGRSHDVHHVTPYRAFRQSGSDVDWAAANVLDNLVTLCRGCHRAAESASTVGGALGGLAYAFVHIASLHLMCDPRDLGVAAEVRPSWAKAPVVAVYERAAGVGFGPTLFDLHETVLEGVRDLVAGCPCKEGCPSCVGAPEERGDGARVRALAILKALGA